MHGQALALPPGFLYSRIDEVRFMTGADCFSAGRSGNVATASPNRTGPQIYPLNMKPSVDVSIYEKNTQSRQLGYKNQYSLLFLRMPWLLAVSSAAKETRNSSNKIGHGSIFFLEGLSCSKDERQVKMLQVGCPFIPSAHCIAV